MDLPSIAHLARDPSEHLRMTVLTCFGDAASTLARPLTPALSPEYEGEGVALS